MTALLRSKPRFIAPLAGLVLLSHPACSTDAPTAPTVGTMEVTTSTTGATPDGTLDPDGYVVTVDGRLERAIGIDGLVLFGLDAGTYEVGLSDVEANCVVVGENPRTVTVAGGETATTSFRVECEYLLREIAFVSTRHNGSGDIFAMGAAGESPLNLTDDFQADAAPAWSPWTPNGWKLAFARYTGDPDFDIVVTNGVGADRRYLTGTLVGAFDGEPAWSPDGTKIAFTSDRDAFFLGELDIYVIDVDGGDPRRLTDAPGSHSDPAWSPDGTKIAFASDRNGDFEIYVMNADGGDPVRLTDAVGADSDPAWSPDGTKIAFTSHRDGNAEVYVMNADGSNPVNLTNHPGSDSDPAWSYVNEFLGVLEPRIAFTTDRDGNLEVYAMDPDGSDPVNLTNDPASDSDPAWLSY